MAQLQLTGKLIFFPLKIWFKIDAFLARISLNPCDNVALLQTTCPQAPNPKTGRDMLKKLDQVLRAIALLSVIICFPAHGEQTTNDPLEGYNRFVFGFNDKADRFVLKPIAKGYKAVTPDPVERSVRRFFDNLGEVVNVFNDILQGKFGQAANDTGRFLVNSTVGVLGFFDVAEDMGLRKNDGEDFGQTLGHWGVGSGPYFVIPFLGPSTVRDAPARIVDTLVNPISQIDDTPTRYTVYAVDFITTRAQLLDAEELITGDKYVFIREVYLQRRAYLVNDGDLSDSFGDDFGDDYGDDYSDDYGDSQGTSKDDADDSQ